MRIGTSMSTKRLDEVCVNEYKIPLIVMMENAILSAIKHLDMDLYDKYIVVSGEGCKGICSWKYGKNHTMFKNQFRYTKGYEYIL